MIAIVFSIIALCACWGLQRDLATGVARDEIYTFSIGSNPIGFAAVICGKLFVLLFCLAEILHAAGLVGDPVLLLRALFD